MRNEWAIATENYSHKELLDMANELSDNSTFGTFSELRVLSRAVYGNDALTSMIGVGVVLAQALGERLKAGFPEEF
jgi:hypothetical protein